MAIAETGSPSALGFDPSRLARLRPWMQRHVDAGRIPGALTLVARRGTVVWCESVGQRDVARGLPWTRDTIARFYSMSKPITSTALLALVEDGLCRLDDPVEMFLPEFAGRMVLRADARGLEDVAPARTRMTLQHLLTHTSGLTYYFNEGTLADAYQRLGVNFGDKGGSLADSVTRLAAMPLAFEPGAHWTYSVATDVIGRIVEVISGQPLDLFLRQRILDPLGMKDTAFDVPPDRIGRLACLYTRAPGDGMTLVDDAPASNLRAVRQFSGGGGLVSTADDYLRFAEMQRRGGALGDVRILGPRTVALMTRSHLPGDIAAMQDRGGYSEVTYRGMGFGLCGWVMLDPARAAMHGSPGDFGWGGMASTVYIVDPAEEMTVIFLTQLTPSDSYPLRKELRALVYSSLID